MKRIAGIMTILFLAIALAVPVTAQVSGRRKVVRPMMRQDHAPAQTVRGMGFADLTTEQQEELDNAQKSFLDETVDLRNDIRIKSTELNNLLRTADPDVNKAKAIQKEISALNAELDQKRLEFRLKVLEINPDARYGMGSVNHKMMGPGAGM